MMFLGEQEIGKKEEEKTGMSVVAGKRLRFTERENKRGDVGERQERD